MKNILIIGGPYNELSIGWKDWISHKINFSTRSWYRKFWTLCQSIRLLGKKAEKKSIQIFNWYQLVQQFLWLDYTNMHKAWKKWSNDRMWIYRPLLVYLLSVCKRSWDETLIASRDKLGNIEIGKIRKQMEQLIKR